MRKKAGKGIRSKGYKCKHCSAKGFTNPADVWRHMMVKHPRIAKKKSEARKAERAAKARAGGLPTTRKTRATARAERSKAVQRAYRYCTSCGQRRKSAWRFCAGCGGKLA